MLIAMKALAVWFAIELAPMFAHGGKADLPHRIQLLDAPRAVAPATTD